MSGPTKRCIRCSVWKDQALFSKNRRAHDGLQARCKECDSAYTKERARLKPHQALARSRKWAQLNPHKAALGAARRRAAAGNYPFALNPEDLPEVPEFCPALGIPLIRSTDGTGASDNSPSLDKLRPHLGYVPGNVCWISKRANTIKQNATAAELLSVALWLAKELNKC